MMRFLPWFSVRSARSSRPIATSHCHICTFLISSWCFFACSLGPSESDGVGRNGHCCGSRFVYTAFPECRSIVYSLAVVWSLTMALVHASDVVGSPGRVASEDTDSFLTSTSTVSHHEANLPITDRESACLLIEHVDICAEANPTSQSTVNSLYDGLLQALITAPPTHETDETENTEEELACFLAGSTPESDIHDVGEKSACDFVDSAVNRLAEEQRISFSKPTRTVRKAALRVDNDITVREDDDDDDISVANKAIPNVMGERRKRGRPPGSRKRQRIDAQREAADTDKGRTCERKRAKGSSSYFTSGKQSAVIVKNAATPEQVQSLAEFKLLTSDQKRKIIIDYYEGVNKDAVATKQYFIQQRHWPEEPVRQFLRDYISLGKTQCTKASNRKVPDKFAHMDSQAVCAAYKAALAAADNDPKKVDVDKILAEHKVGRGFLLKAIAADAEIKSTVRATRLNDELYFEARRSLVVAYFVNATGDYRERRNACVRYFTKVLPTMRQSVIFQIVDGFVRTGTVRSVDRNQQLDWHKRHSMKRGLNFGKKLLELGPSELQFMSNLQALRQQMDSVALPTRGTTGAVSMADESSARTIRLEAELSEVLEQNLLFQQENAALRNMLQLNGAENMR